MIDATDIKSILFGALGNSFLFVLNVSELQMYSSIFWHSAVSIMTIYFLYKNHKNKNK